MTLSRSRIALVALILVLAACSGGTATTGASGTPVTGGGASPSVSLRPRRRPRPMATPTPMPSPSGSASLAPLPTDFDACTLLTDDQAAAINGSSYPAGVNHLLNSGFIECVWQTPTPPSSITVQVLATSGDTSAQEAYAKAQATVHGFALTPVPNFARRGRDRSRPRWTATTGGIYVRDGSIFFDVVYLGGTVPSDGALTLAATLVLAQPALIAGGREGVRDGRETAAHAGHYLKVNDSTTGIA